MIRRANAVLSLLAVLTLPIAAPQASAQEEPEIEIEDDSGEQKPPEGGETGGETGGEGDIGTAGDPEIDMTVEGEGSKTGGKKGEEDLRLGETRASWQDIVVVIRKPFLKMNRLELVPAVGSTLNDNMIRHYEFNGQINYWLTDVLAVGLEGQVFVKDFLETYDLVARQQRRLPTLNKYNFGGSLNFHYVPIYAKFSVLNNKLVHMEGFFTAGVGVTQTEVIPRDPALPSWTNTLITPNVGFTLRVFLTDWLTLNLGFKDYIFIDKYEAVDRSADPACAVSVDCSRDQADGKLINHVMFSAGLSFWFPTSFRYTTFR
jgi:outer membrane beta-barrel protein